MSVLLAGRRPGSAAAALAAADPVAQLNKVITTAVAVFETCEFITPLYPSSVNEAVTCAKQLQRPCLTCTRVQAVLGKRLKT